MPHRIPQPPIDRLARPAERHEFWSGFVAALLGLGLAFGGLKHLTEVETVDGHTATEMQLVKAFSTGGIQYVDAIGAGPPPALDDPAAAAAAFERLERVRAGSEHARWKVRVNTSANTPCPT